MSTIKASASNIGDHDASSIALACKELSHHGVSKNRMQKNIGNPTTRNHVVRIGGDELSTWPTLSETHVVC